MKTLIRKLINRHRERTLRRNIRVAHAQAEMHRDHANYYEGEVIPALSLELANLMHQRRSDAYRPLLAQVRPPAQLRRIDGGRAA